MAKIIENKLLWVTVIFTATLFVPWQTIYKGTKVFAVLPLWWEYAKPFENILVIIGHLFLSAITGVTVAIAIRKYIHGVSNNGNNT